jgi:hypothetical protein
MGGGVEDFFTETLPGTAQDIGNSIPVVSAFVPDPPPRHHQQTTDPLVIRINSLD